MLATPSLARAPQLGQTSCRDLPGCCFSSPLHAFTGPLIAQCLLTSMPAPAGGAQPAHHRRQAGDGGGAWAGAFCGANCSGQPGATRVRFAGCACLFPHKCCCCGMGSAAQRASTASPVILPPPLVMQLNSRAHAAVCPRRPSRVPPASPHSPLPRTCRGHEGRPFPAVSDCIDCPPRHNVTCIRK